MIMKIETKYVLNQSRNFYHWGKLAVRIVGIFPLRKVDTKGIMVEKMGRGRKKRRKKKEAKTMKI